MPPSAEPVWERSGWSLEIDQHGGLLAQGPAFGEFGGVDHTQRRRQAGRAGADDHDIIHCFDMLRTHSLDSRTTAVIMEP